MAIVFSLLLFLHAIIHAVGFSKAFGLRDFENVSHAITRQQGLAWGFCTLLFAIAAGGSLLNKKWWPVVALVGIAISQVLVVINWSNAGWGTAINIVILLVAIIQFADFRFQQGSANESKDLLAKESLRFNGKITAGSITHLPAPVQNWLQHSGIVGRLPIRITRLKQKGKMKTDPAGTWMPFNATQYITATNPGYTWNVKVRWRPMIFITGRDELDNGKGSMHMKMLSMWDMADVSGNEQVNSSSLIRWLAEICWSPSMALNPAIKWQEIDSTTAQAVLAAGDNKVSGIFYFNTNNDITKFTARRYKSGKDSSSLETWQVDMLNYKTFNGVRIPARCRVTWKLHDGDFTWLDMEITNIEYNNPALYN